MIPIKYFHLNHMVLKCSHLVVNEPPESMPLENTRNYLRKPLLLFEILLLLDLLKDFDFAMAEKTL